ncbi:SLC13 family permease [Oricola cellulosilytica]|uniref:SLC13 family permease n=1 Tax=Oricola cellulosilytica TaxID=1429082 RepID=A0A4V2MP68_9HYPH|nr:SLC13 family permease [Oricola cellulosilytica]TCD16582.1 SLC13 family permease [Oricola cellulosilytica]
MTGEQVFLFGLFAGVFVFLVWGRFRYDLVAFSALIIAVIAGPVEADSAFAGFGHPAVVIIALVLVVSRGLVNSGAVELIAPYVIKPERKLPAHLGVMSVAGAALSAVINNVAALALLMPLDLEAAAKAKRAVALSLMPLSFATILGGMITLIGTPPNIVISQYRAEALGEPFSMFDFAPTGLAVATIGIIFVAAIGWRLIPARDRAGTVKSAEDAGLYVAEARVKNESRNIGKRIRDLYPLANDHDVVIVGLIRRGRRVPGFARNETLAKGDFLVLEGDPKSIETFMGAADLDFSGSEKHDVGLTSSSLALVEALVPDGSRIVGRSAMELRLLYRHGITLLGVSRSGERFRDRVRRLTINAGDVLLLLGPEYRMNEITQWLGVWPLEGRRTPLLQRRKASAAILAFGASIGASVAGLVTLDIALSLCVVAYVLMGLLNANEVYEAIEWKVIVLLGSLIPLGTALEQSGGTTLIAQLIVDHTYGMPAWAVLTVLMVVTMTLSDFLNNVATTLIAAPIGVGVATALGVNPDPFLMAVAVAASCAFLTPIGHKNNTIIMGPGGYRFGDYWRMGIVLEVLVIAVSVPVILVVWPL